MSTQNARYQHAQRDTEVLAAANAKLREIRLAGDTRRWVGKLQNTTVIYEGGYTARYFERFGSLAAALTAFGSSSVHAYLNTVLTLTANATIPANVFVERMQGGGFNLNGFTLTIQGDLNADRTKQLFFGTGSVIFSTRKRVYSTWFGAMADGTDEYAAITRGLASISSVGGEYYLTSGTHLTNQSIEYPADDIILCGDYDAILKAKTGGTFPQPADNGWVLRCNGFDNCSIFDITVDGNKSGNPTGRTFGLYLTGDAGNFFAENAQFINCPANGGSNGLGGDGITVGQAGAVPHDIRITNCVVDGNVRTGIALIEGEDIIVSNCIIRNTTGANLGVGIDIETDSGSSTSRNITVANNLIYNNNGGGMCVVSRLTDNMTGITITGNVFHDNSSTDTIGPSGILVNSHRQGLVISGNTFDGSCNATIDLLDSANVSISGNTFVGHYNTDERAMIRMYASTNDVQGISITGNNFMGGNDCAILLDAFLAGHVDIKGVNITGNTFRNCVGPSKIADTAVVRVLSGADASSPFAERVVSYITMIGNMFLDTRGGSAANYWFSLAGTGAVAAVNTNAVLGNIFNGFGAGTPYTGSATPFNLAPQSFNAGRILVTDANKSIGTPSTAPYWDATNQYLGIGAAGARNLDIQVSMPGGSVSSRVANTSNTASSSAQHQVEAGGSSAQESSQTFLYTALAAGSRWTHGRRHSNGHYVIAQASDLTSTSTYAIDIDNSQNVEISIGNLTVAKGDLVFGTAGKGITYQAGPKQLAGSGTPEGAVTAPVGSTYCRSNGGAATSFYVKESGAGNTGWVAK